MIHYTVCRLCSACCPIEAIVEKGKLISAERLSFLLPNKRLVCPKLKAAPDIVYSKDRILKPLIRKGRHSEFRESSWEEALSFVAEHLQKIKDFYGAPSVAWLRGMAADWGAPWDYANRLMSAFGSPNVIGNGSVCHVAREMAHVYTYGVLTAPMAKDAKCIVIWGKNDKNTAPGMAEAILFAKERGAKLIVVDPVRTFFTKRADIWLQIRPGHDGLLAMAFLHEIIKNGLYDRSFVEKYTLGFDKLCQVALNDRYDPDRVAETLWLNPELIKEAARLYASTKPACIIDGNGLDMQLEVFQATRAVALLRSITGNLDVPGGDFITQPVPLKNIQLKELLSPDIQPITSSYPLFNSFHPTWGLHAQSSLIDAILEEDPYAIRGLIVQSGNPAVTMTEAHRVSMALERLEFLVVIDLFKNRTAHFADVILPATTCFEKTQLNRVSMRNSLVVLQNQVIPWVGDSRPDWKITFDMAHYLGLGRYFPWKTVEEAIDEQLEPSGLSVEKLREHPQGLYASPLTYEKYRTNGFSTPSGKVEIFSERLELAGHDPVPYMRGFPEDPVSFSDLRDQYPLLGISGERRNCYTHTQFFQIEALRKLEPEPFVEIHPEEATSIGINTGDRVVIRTPRGEVRMRARVSDIVPRKVVRIPWGWGELDPRWSLNNLTDDRKRNSITGTPSSRSFYCRIERERI
ncbi:MAG: molybdopterin-dependent oxidoreductase [Syntrophobacterales bacterium]|nr:molybdopterin-dependent oxidoreductase [Syntrophobacterales bacterium]